MDPQTWAAVRDLGVGGLMAVALIGGFRGWYVFKWVYEAAIASLLKQLELMTTDRDFWRTTALAAMRHTDKALDVVAQKTPDA